MCIRDRDKEATATTREGLDQVIEKAGMNVKNLPMRQVITSFAGLRAHEDGHEFIIRELPGAPGFVDCAGIAVSYTHLDVYKRQAVPGHGGQTARTGRAAGELERQIPAPAQRKMCIRDRFLRETDCLFAVDFCFGHKRPPSLAFYFTRGLRPAQVREGRGRIFSRAPVQGGVMRIRT